MKACLLIAFLVLTTQVVCAQIYLSLEFPNKAATIKYGVGQPLHFKTKAFPDEWRKGKITKIDPVQSYLFFKDDFLHMNEIIAVRRFNPWANYIGNGLYIFSTQWLLIGGIAYVFLDYKPGVKDLIIPAVSLAIGWSFKKFLSKDIFIIGKSCRLRIIDLRMEIKE